MFNFIKKRSQQFFYGFTAIRARFDTKHILYIICSFVFPVLFIIDGIIKEDQLGFNNIYIQAKKWSADHKVSRPEVQKFAGALQGEKATKGLFITTTEFTRDAQDFAANLLSSNIVLIDGNQLTKLMIKYNLGVAVEQTYEIKRIDSDFFSEDL